MGITELPEDLNTLKVTELKEKLKERGLGVSGVKAELISRLQEYEKKQNAQPAKVWNFTNFII